MNSDRLEPTRTGEAMTFDDAIEHCEQTARSCNGECSDDHHQLAEWLRELKRLREERDEMRTNEMLAILGQDTLKTAIDRLRSENAKLRELVGQYHSAMRCMLETGTWPTDPAYLEEKMRELGIEVEGWTSTR